MLERAPDFNEKNFQYNSFSAFVRDCKGIAIDIRGTTDFAVAPAEHAESLSERTEVEGHTRIRPHFWRAFVSFPKDNEVRSFIPETGRVYIGPPGNCPPSVPIPPIPREVQLKWRRDFINSLGEESELRSVLPELTLQGGFKAFTVALEDRPGLRKRWHSVLVDRVASTIRAWGEPIKLPDEAWLLGYDTSRGTQGITEGGVRQRIYALLDQVRTEDLLELRIPIRWFLDTPPKHTK